MFFNFIIISNVVIYDYLEDILFFCIFLYFFWFNLIRSYGLIYFKYKL